MARRSTERKRPLGEFIFQCIRRSCSRIAYTSTIKCLCQTFLCGRFLDSTALVAIPELTPTALIIAPVRRLAIIKQFHICAEDKSKAVAADKLIAGGVLCSLTYKEAHRYLKFNSHLFFISNGFQLMLHGGNKCISNTPDHEWSGQRRRDKIDHSYHECVFGGDKVRWSHIVWILYDTLIKENTRNLKFKNLILLLK